MNPPDVLLWALAAIAIIVAAIAIITITFVIYAMAVGFKAMRDDDAKETPIFTGRGVPIGRCQFRSEPARQWLIPQLLAKENKP